MESKQETSSVILKLMGLDRVSSQHHTIRNRQKVLSEDYLKKVASIGVRKKRSSQRCHCYGMSTDENEESDDVLKVVKTIRRDKNHNPSKGNGKENLSLFGTKVEGLRKLETLVSTANSFSLETSVKTEQGNLFLQQKTNNGLHNVVHVEARSCKKFSLSKSQLDLKDVTFNSRIDVSKVNSRKEGNCKIQRNIRCKVGVGNSFARKTIMTKPIDAASVITDNFETMTKDDLFQKYWGFSKNASLNWSINQKDHSKDMNLKSRSEKSPFLSYFVNNDTESCADLHKLKKRCYGNDLSEKEPMPSQLSSSDPSPSVIDMKNNKHRDSNMLNKIAMSLDSSVDFLVFDAMKTEVVDCFNNNPTMQQSESTASSMTHEDNDSLSHGSYVSKQQQETSEFQDDSAYSLCIGYDADSLGNFQEAYETSPISVLDSTFREDISVISECGGAGVYDSSEVDDEGLDLNVSSDEDCENKSVGDFEEKKDIVGLSRTEESRDFSYVVEVLTEAGICNKSLLKDFSTWHSAEYPISPSVFEVLEKKFGEQQLWKRSERRLLFDRINLGLLVILHPYLYVPKWEKPVSRRVNSEPNQDMIEEEMWGLLVSQENKAGKESMDNMLGGEIRWIELCEDVEDIVREIVKLLSEELVDEIVRLEDF
ncbi:uncharacterized protein [Cicer arietinum]|uniref:Uncharacterized protein LOC101499857 isoform X2 n=1 Tax=Cicer arietinum TaxID=3827 RepID=A0A1S2Z2W8_CICAR|nr:uncharacterized protein LOC101499857 isoform X2 [Cicer arietinum]